MVSGEADAVWLATRGYADDITFADHPPAGKILADFVANGGLVWACGACTGPRGIATDDLVDGAAIVTAANLAEALVAGAATVAFLRERMGHRRTQRCLQNHREPARGQG